MNEENTLTEEQLNSLFEQTEEETVKEEVATDVPELSFPGEDENSDVVSPNIIAPTEFTGMQNEIENEEVFGSNDREFDAGDIIAGMKELDEDGHSTGIMMASLSILHGVTPDMTIDNVPEENREQVDGMQIENVKFDLYSLDGNLYNLVLTADTPQDAYLNELYQLLNRYRMLQENIAINGPDTDVPFFNFTAMPKTLNGRGAMSAVFPVAYFRVLNDNCVNTSLMMQFYESSISFAALNLSEDEKSEMIADVMREVEQNSSVSMFED